MRIILLLFVCLFAFYQCQTNDLPTQAQLQLACAAALQQAVEDDLLRTKYISTLPEPGKTSQIIERQDKPLFVVVDRLDTSRVDEAVKFRTFDDMDFNESRIVLTPFDGLDLSSQAETYELIQVDSFHHSMLEYNPQLQRYEAMARQLNSTYRGYLIFYGLGVRRTDRESWEVLIQITRSFGSTPIFAFLLVEIQEQFLVGVRSLRYKDNRIY